MRIGIVGLLHESNTFVERLTTIDDFRQDLLVSGPAAGEAMRDSHHEIGGFFHGLAESRERDGAIESVPILVARALPSGVVSDDAFGELTRRITDGVDAAGPLDGLLVAAHGAMVSQSHHDADGYWLSCLRQRVGAELPMVTTLDAHANLSPQMVASCTALIGYRTNPHIDQHARGCEAAHLLLRTIRGEVTPVMAASFPPLAIGIERQLTSAPPCRPLFELADRMLAGDGVLSNSILLGFPYADVPEMGSATLVVTDGDQARAAHAAHELAQCLWDNRADFAGEFTDVDAALAQCATLASPICLLDMGDNVGGGSPADGTYLAHALHEGRYGAAFVCMYDPAAVQLAQNSGPGQEVEMELGGKTDERHGPPLVGRMRVESLHQGRFQETSIRHGGIASFDQGQTAIVTNGRGLTIMLTSRRMVPFSLQQLKSCGVDPGKFRLLVAKGVHAPVAAYREVCRSFVRINTPGSTCADMTRLEFRHRRRPLVPFEPQASWTTDLVD